VVIYNGPYSSPAPVQNPSLPCTRVAGPCSPQFPTWSQNPRPSTLSLKNVFPKPLLTPLGRPCTPPQKASECHLSATCLPPETSHLCPSHPLLPKGGHRTTGDSENDTHALAPAHVAAIYTSYCAQDACLLLIILFLYVPFLMYIFVTDYARPLHI
jgi:hypothetical protein